jgi:RNA recognition motif-containing protein
LLHSLQPLAFALFFAHLHLIRHSLEDWPANDIRLFVGDIAKEVNESMLLNAFNEYKSCAKVKIIYDKRTGASKGFGFVSFLDAKDAANCLRQMNDKFIGGRPIKVKKSEWKDRDMKEVKKKNKRDDKRKKEWI